MRFVIGVDLGQVHDYTAVTIIERRQAPGAWVVRFLVRFPLGTSYPEIVERIKDLMYLSPLRGQSHLALDATGVGRPVLDLFRQAGMGCPPVGISIHGGDAVTRDPAISGYRVPKRDIVSNLQIRFELDQIKINSKMRYADLLVKELQNFRVHIAESGHDSYGAGRSGAHDDLVLALGIAVWLGQKYRPLPARRSQDSPSTSPWVKEFFAKLEPQWVPLDPDQFILGNYSVRLGRAGPRRKKDTN
jgi:hypothetical protein